MHKSHASKIKYTISILKSPPIKRCCYLLNLDYPQKKSKILFEILNASSRSGRGYIALDGRLGLGLNQMIFNSSFDHYR